MNIKVQQNRLADELEIRLNPTIYEPQVYLSLSAKKSIYSMSLYSMLISVYVITALHKTCKNTQERDKILDEFES